MPKNAEGDLADPGESGVLENLYRLRDRVAYALFIKKVLGGKVLLALALGCGILLASNGLDIQRQWDQDAGMWANLPMPILFGIVLAPICAILSIVRIWYGVAGFLLALSGLIFLYLPEFFAASTILIVTTAFLWVMLRPGRGALAALVVLPFLEMRLFLCALAPLGFGCFYSVPKSILLTVGAFVWIMGLGLMTGAAPRFGIEGSGMFDPQSLAALTSENWSVVLFRANRDTLAQLGEELFGAGQLAAPFLIQVGLVVIVAGIVARHYKPVRFHDRLALDYISRDEDPGRRGSLSLLKVPLGILCGIVIWVLSEWIVELFFGGMYSPMQFVADICAALILIPIVMLHYQGDPAMPHEFSSLKPERPAPDMAGSSSSLQIPTPSEMRLAYQSPSVATPQGNDPSKLKLKTWKDKMDVDWEGSLPGGRNISYESTSDANPTPPDQVEGPSQDGFEVGNTIDGQYRIEEIHQGGMGIVFIVTDTFSEVHYAVKTLRDDLRNNSEAASRFNSEAKTWIRLGYHPNVVQAMYYREVKGRPLLFLEYVDGTNLEEMFKHPWPSASIMDLVKWGIQICEGMHFANTKDLGGGSDGLVHRDIKPSNIMLTNDRTVKITDFGLAKVAEAPSNLTREKVGMGTLKYMPPEQVQDAKNVDVRADIYALGAVVYEGLVGHPPFEDENSINLYMSVLSKEAPRARNLRPDISEELDRIVMRCLQKDRDQRFSSFEELGWALKRLLDRPGSSQAESQLRVVT